MMKNILKIFYYLYLITLQLLKNSIFVELRKVTFPAKVLFYQCVWLTPLHKMQIYPTALFFSLCSLSLSPASACEFAEIVELLLKAGADPSIKDQEGSLPEEVTESSAISSLLRQYTAPKG